MVPLSPGTRDRMNALFDPEDRSAAEAMLTRDCGSNLPSCGSLDAAGLERVRYACLKLSRGYLDRLRHWVDEAQKDWRDVLMAADFGTDVRAHETWWP